MGYYYMIERKRKEKLSRSVNSLSNLEKIGLNTLKNKDPITILYKLEPGNMGCDWSEGSTLCYTEHSNPLKNSTIKILKLLRYSVKKISEKEFIDNLGIC